LANVSILRRTEEYSESDQAIGFKDSLKRSKVCLRSGTGSCGKLCCAAKVTVSGKGCGAADFQSAGRIGRRIVEDMFLFLNWRRERRELLANITVAFTLMISGPVGRKSTRLDAPLECVTTDNTAADSLLPISHLESSSNNVQSARQTSYRQMYIRKVAEEDHIQLGSKLFIRGTPTQGIAFQLLIDFLIDMQE